MRYPIIIEPDRRLKKVTEPVRMITDDIIDLLENLHETMLAHDGVGLAAPQVGKNLQVAVVEVEEGECIELINPSILHQSAETNIYVEGCLSIPNVYGTVERSDEVVVSYFDREGSEMEVTAYDFLARTLQHEIDHLQGVLFTDKIIERISADELEKYMEG